MELGFLKKDLNKSDFKVQFILEALLLYAAFYKGLSPGKPSQKPAERSSGDTGGFSSYVVGLHMVLRGSQDQIKTYVHKMCSLMKLYN